VIPDLRRRAVAPAALMAASALVLAGCAQREPVDLPEPDVFEHQLLDEINALRFAEGESRLDANGCLADIARERAATLPGAETVPRDDLSGECGDFGYAGENISRAELGPAAVVEEWASDDLQRPNLVDPGFTDAGVGCVGVAFEDTTRVAEDGEELAGMACSVVLMGPA